VRILIVDDDAVSRESWELLFRLKGFAVEGAANGHAALSRMSLHKPDVAIVDVRMPGMSGTDLLQAMRADPRLAGVRAIFLTALPGHLVEEVREQNPDIRVVQKPVDPRVILDLLGEGGESC
jgi:CheY-like chemotaxis protein